MAENESEAKVDELSRAYAAALLTGDEVAAENVIREAMAADLSMAAIDDEIIAPALWLVGDLWERGEITIADEHLATEISLRVLALEREARRVARARTEHRVLLDDGALLVGEPAGLVEDGVGDTDLAEVVQVGAAGDHPQRRGRHVELHEGRWGRLESPENALETT